METIQIPEAQKQKLLALLKKREDLGIVFFIIGIVGIIPIGITFFGDSATSFYSSPTLVFFILGIVYWSESESAMKKIHKNDYRVFKTMCKKVSSFGQASVENNEILSGNIKKPLKWLEVLDSAKSIKVGEEIGILQVGNDFWVFSLNELVY